MVHVMTIKEFLRTVIDRGRMRVNSRSNGYTTPTDVSLHACYPLLLGCVAVRPGHMEGEVLVDYSTNPYRLEVL